MLPYLGAARDRPRVISSSSNSLINLPTGRRSGGQLRVKFRRPTGSALRQQQTLQKAQKADLVRSARYGMRRLKKTCQRSSTVN